MNLLQKLVYKIKYARYKEGTRKKESVSDIFKRTQDMLYRQFMKLVDTDELYSGDYTVIPGMNEITPPAQIYNLVNRALKLDSVLPSMRAMQFSGEPIEKENQRIFNCSYTSIETIKDIQDIFYMCLCGVGVGYSVRKVHISELPAIVSQEEVNGDFIGYCVEDTKEGWADAVGWLLFAYMRTNYEYVDFDYSEIRPKGSLLKTVGGIAPGYEPLKKALDLVQGILKNARGRQLTSLEVSDIICILADCVVCGGSRRSALICLFDLDDDKVAYCKHGDWYTNHVYRSRANFSAVIKTEDLHNERSTKIHKLLTDAVTNGYGEPGIIVLDEGNDYGFNPCVEILLKNKGLCNLVEIDCPKIETHEDFINAAIDATIIGTIQATFTDFTYVDEDWARACKEDALLGVSLTGLMDSKYFVDLYASQDTDGVFDVVHKKMKQVNEIMANLLGIKPAKRISCIKPAGSTSCVLGCSSGIHPAYSKYYIRRVRVNHQSGIAKLFLEYAPKFIEQSLDNPYDYVISIPIHHKNQTNIYLDDITSEVQGEFALFFYNKWCKNDIYTNSNHNVSVTIQYTADEVKKFPDFVMNLLKSGLKTLSFFPKTDIVYPQAPFEKIDWHKYKELDAILNIEKYLDDVEDILELEGDYGSACEGGKCEMPFTNTTNLDSGYGCNSNNYDLE